MFTGSCTAADPVAAADDGGIRGGLRAAGVRRAGRRTAVVGTGDDSGTATGPDGGGIAQPAYGGVPSTSDGGFDKDGGVSQPVYGSPTPLP